MDQAKLDQAHVDSTTCAPAEGWPGVVPREGNGTSSSPESSSVNGDVRRVGKRQRRRKRSSRSETKAAGVEGRLGGRGDGQYVSPSESRSPGPSAMLLGLQADTVWFGRSAYEQAESSYQRWLVSQASAPDGSIPPAPSGRETSRSPPSVTPAMSEQSADGRHADQEACHHLVQAVLANKPSSDSAERCLMEQAHPRAAPGSLSLPPGRGLAAQPTPDEGYLTQAPTPATPSPMAQQESVNGLPRFPAELVGGVWVEKPRYDQAESAYYQRLYGRSAAAQGGDKPAGAKDSGRPAKVAKDQNGPGPEENGAPRRDKYRPSSQGGRTMTAVQYLSQEKIWFEKTQYDEAERRFYEGVNGPALQAQDTGANTILQDIARARENIQKSLAGLKTTLHSGKGSSCPPKHRRPHPNTAPGTGDHGELVTRMKDLELENQSLHKVVEDLRSALSRLEARVAVLEKVPGSAATAAPCAKQPKERAPVEEEDDDLDLFGSEEEEDAEAERIREQRVKEYTERKAKKPTIIAKSSILLDVKPWDDETDMAKLEECVRSVQADGLLWGTSKLVPVGYGIKKLQIQCVVEDDKVGTDMLEEEITKFEDYVQSVDVAAFNKI
uniref:Elongation factor 1-delta n=2 Tax=Paramormyrops kingsleyae TaxID=1676925 RepID=A0A3B3RBD1_9TELE